MIKTFKFGFFSAWKNRELINQLIKREISLRYSGSYLGIIWSFLNPLALLGVYTFIFGSVFQARWGAGNGQQGNYTVLLFVGMLIHNLFSECINKSSTIILANSNYVKKVIFPLEILTWTIIGAALFHFLTGVFVLIILQTLLKEPLYWTMVLLPTIIIPFIILLAGLSWFLSALGVYFRDVSQLVGMLTTIMMFMSPVFYSISSVPERFRPYMQANPLTIVIEQSRKILIYGQMPDMSSIGLLTLISSITFTLGLWFFNKTKNGFSDVL